MTATVIFLLDMHQLHNRETLPQEFNGTTFDPLG